MKLKDVCTKIGSGATPRGGKESYKTEGVPLIRSQNILDWSFTADGLAFIDDAQAESLDNVEVQPGDVLLNITGDSVARACKVPTELTPARVNQHVAIVRASSQVDPTYLLAFLQHQKPLLLGLASSGATRKALTKGIIENLDINLPSVNEQDKITTVLDRIQQKIVINSRTNDYLAAIIRLEFDRRFSRETPTIDLGDVMSISTQSIKPNDHIGEIWEHYSIPAYDEMHRPIFELADGIKSNKYVIDSDCILVSKLNPSTKRLWLPRCTSKTSVCSTEFIVYRPKKVRYKSFYYAAIDSETFFAFLLSHVTGSTGSRQRSQPKATLNYPIPNPDAREIEDFCEFADPLIAQQQSNEQETDDLIRLRDTLLPKLISGELNIDKIV